MLAKRSGISFVRASPPISSACFIFLEYLLVTLPCQNYIKFDQQVLGGKEVFDIYKIHSGEGQCGENEQNYQKANPIKS